MFPVLKRADHFALLKVFPQVRQYLAVCYSLTVILLGKLPREPILKSLAIVTSALFVHVIKTFVCRGALFGLARGNTEEGREE